MSITEGDDLTTSFLLMGSIIYPLSICCLYLYALYNVFPRIREEGWIPDEILVSITNAYNYLILFLSTTISIFLIAIMIICQKDSMDSRCISPRSYNLLAWTLYLYFCLKTLQTYDTFFMIQNGRVVSHAHAFHHSMMILLSWFGAKLIPCNMVLPLILVNTLHQMLAYSYYCMGYLIGFGHIHPYIRVIIYGSQGAQFGLCFLIGMYFFWTSTCCGFFPLVIIGVIFAFILIWGLEMHFSA